MEYKNKLMELSAPILFFNFQDFCINIPPRIKAPTK